MTIAWSVFLINIEELNLEHLHSYTSWHIRLILGQPDTIHNCVYISNYLISNLQCICACIYVYVFGGYVGLGEHLFTKEYIVDPR